MSTTPHPLLQAAKLHLHKTVRFTPALRDSDMETGFEPGMLADVVSVEDDGLEFRVVLRFDRHESHNRPLEVPCYYDKQTPPQPTLRWSESAFYPASKSETFYFCANSVTTSLPWEVVGDVSGTPIFLSKSQLDLLCEFMATGSNAEARHILAKLLNLTSTTGTSFNEAP